MKRFKCLNCHDEREIEDDIILPICVACQEEMVEMSNREVFCPECDMANEIISGEKTLECSKCNKNIDLNNWEKIYMYDITRNKFKKKNKSPSKLKKKLGDGKFGECYKCNETFKIGQLELEHKIPVMALGHLFKKENIGLVCPECHKEKTKVDKSVIDIMKRMKVFWGGKSTLRSFLEIEEIHKIYRYLFNKIKKLKKDYRYWMNGTQGEDYVTIIDRSNRR